jgi:hypothetical protein
MGRLGRKRPMISKWKRCMCLGAVCAGTLLAQNVSDSGGGLFGGATPIVTGAFGFTGDITNRSNLSFGPKFEPVVLLPLGGKFLFETEYSMELPVERADSSLGPAVLSHSFEYMQLSYFATSNVIITGGNFVTPFGIYKERLDPQWTRNLLDEPMIFPINDNSSIGGMIRASAYLTRGVKLNFAGYYSASEGIAQIGGEKQGGGRVSLYMPGPRIEVGASYSRRLGDERFNVAGADFVWNARRAPVDVRGEAVWANVLGKGYWGEVAWRLANATSNPFFRRSQIVGRVEQYFAPSQAQDLDEELPSLNTKRFSAGYNYWPSDSVKFSVAYGRQIDSSESLGVWTVGVVYRFTWAKGE